MSNEETVTLSRADYDALINRNNDLEDRLVAVEADDGSRVPHRVAVAIIRGESPIAAFRAHLGVTLRDLAQKTGISASHLSEIERGRKAGSVTTLACIARAFDTTIDSLVIE